MAQDKVITLKISQEFKDFLENNARKRKLKPGTFIKAILRKHLKYREKELV